MHRRALRPWLAAAAGLLVLFGGAAAVRLHARHWASRPPVAIATQAPDAAPAPAPAASSGPPPARPVERPAAPTALAEAPRPVAGPAPSPAAPAQQPAQPPGSEPANPAAAAAATPAPARLAIPVIKPSFDVVRVNALGSAVMAGRADPGADVTIRDGEHELGRVKADDQGQWVFLPNAPLAPGSRELTLSERTAGGTETRADGPVLLVVPEPKPELATNPPLPPLAVLTPDNPAALGGARLLQPPPPSGIGTRARLGLDLVQYDDHGAIGFAGSAPPGSAVRLYVDNRKAGDGVADATGRWSVTPKLPITLGSHHVRVDQLTAKGQVTQRVELPFSREVVAREAVADGHVTVQPGENLWRLARHVYGSGLRYTVIYQANREQIRDPRMIYPGQNFAVPDAPPSPEPPPGNPPPGGTAANKPG